MFVAWFQQRASREYLNGASNKPPGRHQIQNAEGPVLDPCAKQIYFRRDPKVDPLRIESGPSWRACFWSFILSDVLKLCKLLCAQNVKLEATLTQTASVAGILNCSRPWLPTRSCYDVWRWCLWPDSNNAPQESIWMGRQTSPQGGTRFRMLRAQFWTLAQSKYISEGTQKWTLLGSKVVPPGGPVFGPFILSDVLKLCKLLCAQNVKLEATLTQTASVAGILNWGGPYLRV